MKVSMAKQRLIDSAGLRALLRYEEETGRFYWRSACGSRKADSLAGNDYQGHILIGIRGTYFLAHRLAWLYVTGEWPEDQIDHINGVKSDNRIANLRPASYRLNAENKRRANRRNRSGYLGVTCNGDRYAARIQVCGVLLNLGRYRTAEEAHERYLKAKRTLHEGCTL